LKIHGHTPRTKKGARAIVDAEGTGKGRWLETLKTTEKRHGEGVPVHQKTQSECSDRTPHPKVQIRGNPNPVAVEQ